MTPNAGDTRPLVHHDVATSRLRTHVVEAGPADGPTLVLVHGDVSSSRLFHPLLEILGQRFHCLAALLAESDLTGCGHSQHLERADEFAALVTAHVAG